MLPVFIMTWLCVLVTCLSNSFNTVEFSWALTASQNIHNFPTKYSADSSSPQNSCCSLPVLWFQIGHLPLELILKLLFQLLTFQWAFGGGITLIFLPILSVSDSMSQLVVQTWYIERTCILEHPCLHKM